MNNELTWLAEKDQALELTLKTIQDNASSAGLDLRLEREVEAVPGMWSVHLVETRSGLYTNGKGTSLLAARVSAHAEFCERLGTGYFFAPLYTGTCFNGPSASWVFDPREIWAKKSSDLLAPALWELYDLDRQGRKFLDKHPRNLAVLADAHTGGKAPGQAHSPADPKDWAVCALPFKSLGGSAGTGTEEIHIPLNLLWNLYASNGLSAGNSPLEARIQGASEVCERYARAQLFVRGMCPPRVSQDVLTPKARDAMAAIQDQGYGIQIRDAGLGLGLPVIVAILIHPQSGEVLLSFGSHPRFQVALERTLSELFQGRLLVHSDDFSAPTAQGELCADPGNLESHFINSTGLVPLSLLGTTPDYEFNAWPEVKGRDEEWARLQSCLDSLGHQAYFREGRCLGICWSQIVVPGISEVYPFEELWEENTSRFYPLRALVTDSESRSSPCLEQALEILEEELGPGHELSPLDQLLGIDTKGSLWDGALSCELKALVFLALDDAESLVDYLEFAFPWGSIRPERRGFWRAVQGKLSSSPLIPGLFEERVLRALKVPGWPHEIYPALGLDFTDAPGQRRLMDIFGIYRSIRTSTDSES